MTQGVKRRKVGRWREPQGVEGAPGLQEGEGRREERRQEKEEEVSGRTKDAQTDGAPEEGRYGNKDTLGEQMGGGEEI